LCQKLIGANAIAAWHQTVLGARGFSGPQKFASRIFRLAMKSAIVAAFGRRH
jgi:hypothetical protein